MTAIRLRRQLLTAANRVYAALRYLTVCASASGRWISAADRARTVVAVTAVSVATVGLAVGCTPALGGVPHCTPRTEQLPASVSRSLIAVVPRTTTGAAVWGLRELVPVLPYVARPGLVLHVLYTQDGDDLGDGGGDGGAPQALLSTAPTFPVLRLGGAPQPPVNPNPLSAQLYCNRLAAWEGHASTMLRIAGAQREMAVRSWVAKTEVVLEALADRPIADTSGAEAGVEIDASASIFDAAQVAAVAPRSAILFLGGLTVLDPPSQGFRLPARLVAVVRSSGPAQVMRAKRIWTRWAAGAGGSFEAVSANDGPETIALAVTGGWR